MKSSCPHLPLSLSLTTGILPLFLASNQSLVAHTFLSLALTLFLFRFGALLVLRKVGSNIRVLYCLNFIRPKLILMLTTTVTLFEHDTHLLLRSHPQDLFFVVGGTLPSIQYRRMQLLVARYVALQVHERVPF